jgi:hypothetical protein
MKLSADDILSLYPRLFYLPEQQEEPPLDHLTDGEAPAVPPQREAESLQPEAPAKTAPLKPQQAAPEEAARTETASAAEAQQPTAAPPATAIIWRERPQQRLTLLVAIQELRDPELAGLLKKIVAALEIPFQHCAFGKVESPFRPTEIAGMPTATGILFGSHLLPGAEEKLELDGKVMHIVPSLADMVNDTAKKRQAWEVMKTFKSKL